MIEIRNVTKQYAEAGEKALDQVSLRIGTGEFFGLLGPNGAGKSTMIGVLSTLLLPTRGQILIDGEELTRGRSDIKGKLALITQHFSMRNDMNMLEILELNGRLYGMPRGEIRRRSQELLQFCGLYPHREKTVRRLSGGMKRKLMLCRALMTDPRILLLDEPTVGLDPASRRQMWDMLRSLNRNGMTILLTTHYIEEAQYLCGKVAMIRKGKVVRVDTPENLVAELGEFAVDELGEKTTSSRFFGTREEALAYAGTLPGKFLLRATSLEDVFLNLTGMGLEGG